MSDESRLETTQTTNPSDESSIDSPARRDAIAKLAVMAAWTAPTLTVLMRSKRASATSAHSESTTPGDPNNY